MPPAHNFPRGARPSPRHKLLSVQPFLGVTAPAQFAMIPKQLDMWGNDQYGDCVTAEEAFKCATDMPEDFIDAQTVIRWASSHGFLNGANLSDVMDVMQKDGFQVGGNTYTCGPYKGVDYSNESVLQSAISQGPVNIAIDANALPGGAGNASGWYATGKGNYPNTDHCFTGDTKVSLLDGRELSFAELADGAAGDSFWVYSCDKEGNVVPGKAHSVRKTRENADLVKVVLDSGESIRCTGDHRFLMRDGTYKEAKDLQTDDSLMPLYRRVSKGGYELCYNPRIKGKRGWRATHRIVAFGAVCRTGGMAAHHVDFNKRNNSPENLRVMTPEDHAALHQQFSEHNRTPEHRAKARELMRALWDDPVWAAAQRAKLRASASARGKRTAAIGHAHLQTMGKGERREMAKRNGVKAKGRKRSPESVRKGAESIRKRIADDPDFRESLRKSALRATHAAALKPVTEKQREARRENARKLNERRQSCANNHKVTSVAPCGREDVYDITVDDHHNFALSAGVFVHNCVSLTGFGPASWLYQQLGVPLPPELSGNSGYLLYTWKTIGFVDHAWLMGTCVEAWLRTPNTLINGKPVPLPNPDPTPPPGPTPVPPPVPGADFTGALQYVQGRLQVPSGGGLNLGPVFTAIMEILSGNPKGWQDLIQAIVGLFNSFKSNPEQAWPHFQAIVVGLLYAAHDNPGIAPWLLQIIDLIITTVGGMFGLPKAVLDVIVQVVNQLFGPARAALFVARHSAIQVIP